MSKVPALRTAAAVVALLAVAPAWARETGNARVLHDGVQVDLTVVRPAANDDIPASPVDETLLRALAGRYDYQRLDAEIRRLKQMHPGWEPPTDLFAPQAQTVDERGLWKSWERGDLPAIQKEVAVLRQLNPGWSPPAKLMSLMRMREVRDTVAEATRQGEWQRIAAEAAAHPDQFTCGQIENLWDLANAHFQMKNRQAAYRVYDQAMTECKDADLRLSTLQKALANRDNALLAPLFEREAARPRSPAQDARFAGIRKDFGGGGKGGGVAGVVGAKPPAEVDRLGLALGRLGTGRATAEDVAWIEETARARRNANAAQALGWHHYNAGRWDEARGWFETALAWGGSAKAAEGLAYSYQRLGREEEARKLAARWSARAPRLGELLATSGSSAAGAALRAGNYAEVLRLTAPGTGKDDRNAGADPLRGWALLQLERPAEAARIFEAALEQAKSGRESDAAHGLVLAQLAQGFAPEARRIMASHPIPADRMDLVEASILAQEAIDAFNRNQFEQSLRLIQERRRHAVDEYALASVEAWALFKLGRYIEARKVFQKLNETYATPDSAEGFRIASSMISGRWD